MLGFSVAVCAGGRLLSKSLLNRAVDVIVRGDLRKSTITIDAGRFYKQTVFESLDVLAPRGREMAKRILSHVAQCATTDFPWVLTADAIDVPELLRIASEKERLNVIGILERIEAIERDKEHGKLRIRPPLTARALRADAVTIRQQAMDELKNTEGDDIQ